LNNLKYLTVWALLWIVAVPVLSIAATKKSKSQLNEVERAIVQGKKQQENLQKKTIDLGNDLEQLNTQLVSVAAAIQQQESDVLDLKDTLQRLRQTEKEKLKLLAEKREQFSYVLMALQRMARHPPEAMIVAPVSPSDTVRVAILLRAAVPAIEENATTLRQGIVELVEVRNQGMKKRQILASVRIDLDVERQSLDDLFADKKKLKKKTDSKVQKVAERMHNLVKRAKNLRDFMSRIEVDRKKRQKNKLRKVKAPPSQKITRARGKFPYPAVGRLVGRYGEAMKTGLTRKGISIETGTGAQVVVPRDGTVVFAGAFKGYGQLLIIEHDGGYLSLLAGLARIDSTIGQQMSSGEPAGIMGKPGNGLPVLYVELRRKGQPINPLPWLAARKIKVNG
jgi:septal ring factor EnvC (AmiA/AmiB activator)